MPNLSVLKPGSKVVIGDKVDAEVISVQVGTFNVVTYLCSWWDENERNTAWLECWQVEVKEEPSLVSIGFKG